MGLATACASKSRATTGAAISMVRLDPWSPTPREDCRRMQSWPIRCLIWMWECRGSTLSRRWCRLCLDASGQTRLERTNAAVNHNRRNGAKASFSITDQSVACRFRSPVSPGLSLTAEGPASLACLPTRRSPFQVVTKSKLHDRPTHSFLLGVHYAFNVSPPTPLPLDTVGPAPAAGAHLPGVLRLGQGDLTDRARQIIADAADASTKCGHADRGERLHRYLGHAAVQPGPVGAPR